VPQSSKEATCLLMKAIDSYSLRPAKRDGEELRSHLLRRGLDTGTLVPGAFLEAQLPLGEEHLLFLTHDCPFEEQLDICLLDAGDRLVDRVSLMAPYSSGDFQNLIVDSPSSARFDFFGSEKWRISVYARPRAFVPLLWITLPAGVHRRFSWHRRLVVEPESRREPARR
jgi:hypothetical protein